MSRLQSIADRAKAIARVTEKRQPGFHVVIGDRSGFYPWPRALRRISSRGRRHHRAGRKAAARAVRIIRRHGIALTKPMS